MGNVLSDTPFCVCIFLSFYSPQSECVQSHNFLWLHFFFTLRKECGMYSVTLLSVSASFFLFTPPKVNVFSHTTFCVCPLLLPVKSVECTQSHSFLCLHLFFFFFYSFQSECVQSHNFLSALFFFTLRKEWGMYSVTLLSVSASFFLFTPPKVNVFSHTTFCGCTFFLLSVKSVECTQ